MTTIVVKFDEADDQDLIAIGYDADTGSMRVLWRLTELTVGYAVISYAEFYAVATSQPSGLKLSSLAGHAMPISAVSPLDPKCADVCFAPDELPEDRKRLRGAMMKKAIEDGGAKRGPVMFE